MDSMEAIVKERPILFSGEMVRAILAGRKTQTRRVIPESLQLCRTPEDELDVFVDWCKYGRPGDRLWVREAFMLTTQTDPLYRASYGEGKHIDPWKPSIHMPRWASRITLEIVGVRVERVWSISDADVRAEGVLVPHGSVSTHYDHFMMLWDSINAKRGYPWESNPWVWVIEFRKVRPILNDVN